MIKVSNLGKRYVIAHKQPRRRSQSLLSEDLPAALSRTFRSLTQRIWTQGRENGLSQRSVEGNGKLPGSHGSPFASHEEFWALRDVDFEVEQGEVLGIIGRNGAGKSTLLKLLSRITEPTTGRIELRGRVASLLEVGTGFHPELTGRENIFLNGAILGMSRAEIKRKFDEIVAFAETERFLDTPVKRYSSGMYVRLAFAVAAHLEPEILIVDEVLAVGDTDFQKKCLGKMSEVSKGGRTVLFVSHNLIAVRSLCKSGILLDEGRLRFAGTAQQAIDKYAGHAANESRLAWARPESLPLAGMGFQSVSCRMIGEQPNIKLSCEVLLRSIAPVPPVFVAVDICDRTATPIMQALPATTPFISGHAGDHRLLLEIDLPPLIPGTYIADFWIGPHFSSTIDYVKNVLTFQVIDSPSSDRSFPHSPDHGFLVPRCRVQELGTCS